MTIQSDEHDVADDRWKLGRWVQVDRGRHTIAAVRELSEVEAARVPVAMERLRDFSGQAMLGPLVDALNLLNVTLDQMLTLPPTTISHGGFRSELNGRMSAVLTAFSGIRAALEAHSRKLALPVSSTLDNFKVLHAKHPSFRLVWELRNLDQHRPPASSVLTVSKDEDPRTGESRSRPTIDVLAVVDRCAKESSKDRYRVQWEKCGALWAGQAEPVDVRAIFGSAYDAVHTVIATHFREAEPWILQDVEFVARLVAEVEPIGSAHAVRVTRAAEGNLNIRDVHLSPTTFGEALATLDAARKILGEPTLDEAGVLPKIEGVARD